MDSFKDLFALVQEACKKELPIATYNLWIRDLEPLRFDSAASTAYISMRTSFMRDIVQEKYSALLERCFAEVMGFEVRVVIETGEAAPAAAEAEEDELSASSYTFNNYIVGSSNRFAHAAAKAVATSASVSSSYNPLFIYGPSGLGKTHLLLAIRNEMLRAFPNRQVCYAKCEDFTNQFISALGKNRAEVDAFHDKYRQVDVLLMDDVQFIGGKEQLQEEFFHTFNALFEAGRQIVFTSDKPPKEIRILDERIRNRFESSLLADVQTPDLETRIAIIRAKARQLEVDIPDEVAEYIANRLKSNIRQLEGTVKKIKAYKTLADTSPSLIIAQKAVQDILNDKQPVSVTVEKIIAEVARTYEVPAAEIRGPKRTGQISSARQIAMYIVHEITNLSMAAIGTEFGGRDHSTVVYALQQAKANIASNAHYKNSVEDIMKNVRNS